MRPTPLKAVSSPLRSVISRMVYDIACRREEEEKGEEGEPRGSLFEKDLNSRRVKGPSPDKGRCLFVTWRLRDIISWRRGFVVAKQSLVIARAD